MNFAAWMSQYNHFTYLSQWKVCPHISRGGSRNSRYRKYPVVEGHFAQDCACAEWILLWHVRQTHSGFHRRYTQTSAKFLIFTKKGSSFMNVLHNFKWPYYTAHHNWLGICHQLKIRHLYGTFNFSTQRICMGIGSLFVYGFRGKARPLRRKTVLAVASILNRGGTQYYVGLHHRMMYTQRKILSAKYFSLRPGSRDRLWAVEESRVYMLSYAIWVLFWSILIQNGDNKPHSWSKFRGGACTVVPPPGSTTASVVRQVYNSYMNTEHSFRVICVLISAHLHVTCFPQDNSTNHWS